MFVVKSLWLKENVSSIKVQWIFFLLLLNFLDQYYLVEYPDGMGMFYCISVLSNTNLIAHECG